MDTVTGVVCRSNGLVSETFVARHVRDLAGPVPPLTLTGEAPWTLGHDPTGRRRTVRLLLAAVFGVPALRRAEREVLRSWVREHAVRAALVEYLDVAAVVGPCLAQLGVRVVAHGHGYDVSARLRRWWWRRLYRRSLRGVPTVVVSRESAGRLAALGLAASDVTIVPCGVDLPEEPAAQCADDARPSDPLRVLMIGRLVEKKAPMLAIAAVQAARRAGGRLQLQVIGDGPLRGACDELLGRGGAAGGIVLHGALPHERAQALLAQCDVFLLPSVTSRRGDTEGLPVALLEAMAAGKAVLSTRHGGIPDAVRDGVDGFLVAEHDTAGLAHRLVTLDRDRALVRRLGANARRRAADFTATTERARLRTLLDGDTT